MIFIFVCSFAAFFVGFLMVHARRSRLENAVVYNATILGYEERIVKRGSMLTRQVMPSVRYNNGKRDIVAVHHTYIPMRDYHYNTGDVVEIRAYPELPKIFYFAEDDNHISYGAVAFFTVSGVLFLLGILSVMT